MSSPWIEHCKAYQRANGCTYAAAMQKAAATYKTTKKGGAAPNPAQRIIADIQKNKSSTRRYANTHTVRQAANDAAAAVFRKP